MARYWVILLLRIAGVNGWAMRLLPAVSVLALVVIAIMVAMQGAELATIHSFHSAGVCSGAGLWFADGLAYGAACGGVVLLDCATVKKGINLRYRCSLSPSF
ncbi:anaerobic dimethyl sulfoxide reductase subunit C [Salmonella enterica subsp. enterica]|uniref:Anaerobic dimethyl sulfoxide reductase subunit C n=1 Tax=Salmonella enterica I TaxID=59201 RepID=A0A447U675_SALET|nr:anaerobic dimethyl sulfoxide reductase subunit C [Salmonella enterica subsp. enterica]